MPSHHEHTPNLSCPGCSVSLRYIPDCLVHAYLFLRNHPSSKLVLAVTSGKILLPTTIQVTIHPSSASAASHAPEVDFLSVSFTLSGSLTQTTRTRPSSSQSSCPGASSMSKRYSKREIATLSSDRARFLPTQSLTPKLKGSVSGS